MNKITQLCSDGYIWVPVILSLSTCQNKTLKRHLHVCLMNETLGLDGRQLLMKLSLLHHRHVRQKQTRG